MKNKKLEELTEILKRHFEYTDFSGKVKEKVWIKKQIGKDYGKLNDDFYDLIVELMDI